MVSLLGPSYYLVKVYIAHAGRRCRFENEQDPPPPPPPPPLPPPGEELKRLLDPCMTDVSKVKNRCCNIVLFLFKKTKKLKNHFLNCMGTADFGCQTFDVYPNK